MLTSEGCLTMLDLLYSKYTIPLLLSTRMKTAAEENGDRITIEEVP